jgi:5-methylcytosine-specific restriction endonuclease McrA
MRPATKAMIRQLGYTSYRAYLLSDVWRMRRVAYFAHHRKSCWICGKTAGIHLHHSHYERLGGYERDTDLVPLCAAHHRGVHTFMKRRRIPVERAHTAYAKWLDSRPARTRRKRTRG